MIYDNVLEAIGHTPMLRLNKMNKPGNAEILVKFEGLNVGGSIKTRTAYNMIRKAEKAGKIKDLELQKKFVLIPAQKRNGKVVERECSYFADFVYTDVDTGETIVEDTKGFITKDYIIKRKLLLFNFDIKITQI